MYHEEVRVRMRQNNEICVIIRHDISVRMRHVDVRVRMRLNDVRKSKDAS